MCGHYMSIAELQDAVLHLGPMGTMLLGLAALVLLVGLFGFWVQTLDELKERKRVNARMRAIVKEWKEKQ